MVESAGALIDADRHLSEANRIDGSAAELQRTFPLPMRSARSAARAHTSGRARIGAQDMSFVLSVVTIRPGFNINLPG